MKYFTLSILMVTAFSIAACAPTLQPGQSLSDINTACGEAKLVPLQSSYTMSNKKVYEGCGQPAPAVFHMDKFVRYLDAQESDSDRCVLQGHKLGGTSFQSCMALRQQQRQMQLLQAELEAERQQAALRYNQQMQFQREQMQLYANRPPASVNTHCRPAYNGGMNCTTY